MASTERIAAPAQSTERAPTCESDPPITSDPPTTVLLIDDDAPFRCALGVALADEGFDVLTACGEDALDAVGRSPVDLVLLDLMLPGMAGLTVCRQLRAAGDLPIIIIGRPDSEDVIAGLEAGADDYVSRPVLADVLAARIRARLRRCHNGSATSRLSVGDLEIRPDERVVRRSSGRDAVEIHLTPTEFRLLLQLASARGRVVSREDLLRRVWGYRYVGDTRLLDVHVRRLRCKIEPNPDEPTLVLTVRSLGYKVAHPGPNPTPDQPSSSPGTAPGPARPPTVGVGDQPQIWSR